MITQNELHLAELENKFKDLGVLIDEKKYLKDLAIKSLEGYKLDIEALMNLQRLVDNEIGELKCLTR